MLSQLVAWLTAAPDPADNVRVVTGGPGSGKSAVLARLVTMSNPRYRVGMPVPMAAEDPVADLPPEAIDVAVHARTAPTDEVVSALAAAAIGVPQADLDGLIDGLLQRWQAVTIVVDALDEADDPPALAQALRRLASETADAGVRLLVGTRPGGPHRRLITALGLSTRDEDLALIDLDAPAYLSRDDLAEYVRRRLLLTDVPLTPDRPDTPYRGRETLADQVATAVARAAYPTFLIGQLVSRALLLRNQPLNVHDPGWQQFPKTVAAAMDQYLASVGDQAGQDRVEDLLRPLAYARGDGLPLDAGLWSLLATALARPGRSYTIGDVATLLDTAADYLIETVITGQAGYYRLYHQALSDRLRERDQQHPRPVSAAQTIYECLLDTVARRPDGTRNWPAAHPYLHGQLAGHAADVGQLTSLVDDPGFLVAADPAELFAALQHPGQPLTDSAQIYRHAYPHLTPGADTAGERASYLQLAARRQRAVLADQLDKLPVHQPWTVGWVRGPRPHPHYIAGRHADWVQAVTVGVRQGRTVIVSGSHDRTVRVWDLETGEPVLGPLTGHDGWVNAVAIGVRYGRPVIISGGGDRDQTVRVWDLESGEPVLGPLTGHQDGGVEAVTVGVRYGRPVIISGGWDGVRVWDLESGEPVLGPLTGHQDGGVEAVAVGVRYGRPVIISGGWDGVLVWDLESGDPVLGPLTGHHGRVDAVAVGERRGRPVIISASWDDRTVRVWDLESGDSVLGPLTGHDAGVEAVTVGVRHGRPVIISSGWDGVLVCDLESGEPVLGPLAGHDGGVQAVTVGVRQGRTVIVSGGDDRTVRVWDLESGEPALGPQTGHHDGGKGPVAVGTRHGRTVIISGSIAVGGDGTVRVWDLESGEQVLGPLTGHHDGGVDAVAVGVRHGRPVIISGGGDGDQTVRVWDLESGEPVLGPLADHVEAVAVGVRHGRTVIVSGGGDGTVRVWDLESGEPVLGPFTGYIGVYAVAVGECHGRQVIVSGLLEEDEEAEEEEVTATVRVWDLESGEPVLDPLICDGGEVDAVAVGARHGRAMIVSGGSDGVLVWDIEAEHRASLRIAGQYRVLSVVYTADQLVIGTEAELVRVDLP